MIDALCACIADRAVLVGIMDVFGNISAFRVCSEASRNCQEFCGA